jgi:hypothetical protein
MRGFFGHPMTRLVLGIASLLVPVIVVQLVLPLADRPNLGLIVGLVVMVGSYLAFVRWVERRPPTELALRPAPRELAIGLATGGLLFSVTVGVLWLAGAYSVVGHAPWTVLGPAAAAALASGVTEELIVRGVVFRCLEEWLGTWLATALSALLFGLLHLANPHAGLVPALAIALEAGVLLAAGFVLTRRLWLPIGLHIAWNFTQAGIFGVAVSGNEIPGVLRAKIEGPDWLSGGAFGAEASVVAVVVCTTTAFATFWLAARRGNVLVPSWQRKT